MEYPLIRLLLAGLLCALIAPARAAYEEPTSCQQLPALTGPVTKAAGSCVTAIPGASSQRQPGNPTAPASTSAFKMQGLAGAITPVRTGTVLIVVSGFFTSSAVTAGDGILIQLSFGTGSAPSNAATLTGTQVGAQLRYVNPTTLIAADVAVPFSIQAVVTGLPLNTAHWVDLAAESVSVISIVGLSNVSISVIEQ